MPRRKAGKMTNIDWYADKQEALSVEEIKNYRSKTLKDEIDSLYRVMDFIFDAYEEIGDRRIELLEDNKDITENEMGQFTILEHMINLYKGVK